MPARGSPRDTPPPTTGSSGQEDLFHPRRRWRTSTTGSSAWYNTNGASQATAKAPTWPPLVPGLSTATVSSHGSPPRRACTPPLVLSAARPAPGQAITTARQAAQPSSTRRLPSHRSSESRDCRDPRNPAHSGRLHHSGPAAVWHRTRQPVMSSLALPRGPQASHWSGSTRRQPHTADGEARQSQATGAMLHAKNRSRHDYDRAWRGGPYERGDIGGSSLDYLSPRGKSPKTLLWRWACHRKPPGYPCPLV
ncbi:hypothetical protein NDU88_001613 [Pleurodeles waltl]|uniref:Uncharacterized protein n=1 Tax=Pleurodeles waltl TaxID=8319 RepID=A0AAV7NB91_PLEWA|nr:hypothetical protein NDU88_001613 [Pleurodeles waltl]